ncbi:unnamed protein product [Paramecium pentaurelia]|uniref:Uncharacterized protein n=1 Tax=Paramecium pentaurelia TaxID=43138 RepID=A0A8S1X7C0_9CILI|nr:unnamed protein product [Paramecium pentaurelia]
MHPFAQYPPFFQYSQNIHHPQPSLQQFNPYQHQLYINNYLWLNYQRAQQTHLFFQGSTQSPPIIKQENVIKQEQCILQQSNFEPVEFITNHENSKSAQLLKKSPNIQSQKNKRKGKRSNKRKLYNIGNFFNLILRSLDKQGTQLVSKFQRNEQGYNVKFRPQEIKQNIQINVQFYKDQVAKLMSISSLKV